MPTHLFNSQIIRYGKDRIERYTQKIRNDHNIEICTKIKINTVRLSKLFSTTTNEASYD
jgi:hypothetical protein